MVGVFYNIVLGKDFLRNFSAIIDVRGQVFTFVAGNTVMFALEMTHQSFQILKLQKLWLLMLKVSRHFVCCMGENHSYLLMRPYCCHRRLIYHHQLLNIAPESSRI